MLGNPDNIASILSASLDASTRRLNQYQKSCLASSIEGSSVEADSDRHAKRALLVVATCVMLHSRLDAYFDSAQSDRSHRTRKASLCVDDSDPVASYLTAWDLILALDYKPIFETGRAALQSCSPDLAFTTAIRETAKAALAVAGNADGLRHDLMGRIFHTVLDSARYDGSFYTTTAAATLLATLAIRSDMCDWRDPEAVRSLRIADPACGTGTLLMAAAERIRYLSPRTNDEDDLSRMLIERVLSGYDVNLTALHLASAMLGMLSPSTSFSDMRLGHAYLGVDDYGDAYLGSLEFLDTVRMCTPIPFSTHPVSQFVSGDRIVHHEPSDLVIMNPPYTRDSLRHDQFNSLHEQRMKAREKLILSNKPVHLSSIGNAFLVLADYLRKSDSSVVASILPTATATHTSSLAIRQFLSENYHIETIVTSHDPKRIYFSENTTIGEIMLVCRLWTDSEKPKPPTRVINLAVNPSTPPDAISVANAINNNTMDSKGYGIVQEWPSSRIGKGDWGAVQFLSPYLCDKFFELRNGDLFQSTALGNISEWGSANIRGIFNRFTSFVEGGVPALWDHKTDVTQTMFAEPDAYIRAKQGKELIAGKLWDKRRRLMMPARVHLPTVRVFSVRLSQRTLGSAWVPCQPQIDDIADDMLEKAFCAYFNSSIGILALLGNRSNKTLSYPQFSMTNIRSAPIPDFAVIGRDAVHILADAYDEMCERVLMPLPQMENDSVRIALDRAVCQSLSIQVDCAVEIRRHLVNEPSVTNKRYAVKV